jgi:hypothetical protein
VGGGGLDERLLPDELLGRSTERDVPLLRLDPEDPAPLLVFPRLTLVLPRELPEREDPDEMAELDAEPLPPSRR